MNYIFLFIIILCVAIIAYIVISKFSQMANLDLGQIEKEKVSKKKKEIILRKVDKESGEVQKKIGVALKPVGKIWGKLQLKFRIYVGKVQELWQHEQVVKTKEKVGKNPQEKENKLEEIIREGERYLEEKNLEKAENSFITAISLENKSAPAYRGLGDVYMAKNELEEARQTYLFLTRLEPDDDSAWVKLAEIAESQGDLEEAISYYQKAVLVNDSLAPRFYHLGELLLKIEQPDSAIEAIVQAVELEPQNPRYLDLLIENAIICGNKELAIRSVDKLKMVNPDNNKLDSFRERIFKI